MYAPVGQEGLSELQTWIIFPQYFCNLEYVYSESWVILTAPDKHLPNV